MGSSERQQFETDPKTYLSELFDRNDMTKWPHHIMGFSKTMHIVSNLLTRKGYEEKLRLWNCLLPADDSNECSLSIYTFKDKLPNK